MITQTDPADTGFQSIEDLACAYWYSQVLFTALELGLFTHLDQGADHVESLAEAVNARPLELARLLAAMAAMGLVSSKDGRYWNNQAAALYLVKGKPDYMGEFFLYRRYMRSGWDRLTAKVTGRPQVVEPALSYEEKNLNYARAMDILARQKAGEIAILLNAEQIRGPMLDIGGGAGALARAIRSRSGPLPAVLFDIPEVIAAANILYPDPLDWEGIEQRPGDFRTADIQGPFGVILLGNFLHAYGAGEARELFDKAVRLLDPEGVLVIHDYFPDLYFPDPGGARPQKGALYDLAMMLNTYNGACHPGKTLLGWCREAGLESCGIMPLSTDSGVILARRTGPLHLDQDPLVAFAADLDIEAFIPLDPADVVTAPWAREKCRFGCPRYDNGLQCPPHTLDHEQTRKLLDSYSRAFLVRGTPPGKDFHNTLLSLEKKAFLEGYHKAFVLGAGPCNVCPDCPPEDGKCRFPHLSRPSMEGSGIDVYETAAHAGIDLKPVRERGQYVTYLGLLLVA